jgi:hypothetical protein
LKDWRDSGHLAPEGFHPTSVRVVNPELTLLAGWIEPFDESDAILLSVTPSGMDTLFEEPGKLLAVDVADDSAIWVLWSDLAPDREGSDYGVFLSCDGGRTWNEGFTIQASSVTRLLAVSATEAWLLGSDTLLRTTDGGARWSPVEAPGTRNAIDERLAINGRAVLILGDHGIMATTNGGAQWEIIDTGDTRATAVDGGAFMVRSDRQMKLGTRRNGKLAWLGTFSHDATPVRLVAEGSSLRFLALPSFPEEKPGVFYFATTNAGQDWDVRLLPGRVIEGSSDLRSEGGATVSADGTIYLL